MALFVLLAAFLLAATPVHVAGQPGFLSIDCGLDDPVRMDTYLNITYVSDGPYVDGGENRVVEVNQDNGVDYLNTISLKTLRSFPSDAGERNCYTLPTESGDRYLIRLEFKYGNYDGTNRPSSLHFDLHLGTNYWRTVWIDKTDDYWAHEAVFAAWARWVPVCLLNTGNGTPFVSTVELRHLGALYPDVKIDQPMARYDRVDMGVDYFQRFATDPYDRYWWGESANFPLEPASSSWANISTQSSIAHPDHDSYAVPIPILQTAITTVSNNVTVLNVTTWYADPSAWFKVYLHFTDFQNSQFRQFDIYITEEQLVKYRPKYLNASTVSNPGWLNNADGNYNITLAATSDSMLPPIISAYEIYRLIRNVTSRTFSKDFDAMMAIKNDYGIKKNWNGDPCLPANYTWSGVKCSNSTGTTRIISLDLSNNNLNGSISDNFALLTELKFLNMSGNSLNGPVPYTLCKKNGGPLVFRSESGEDLCSKSPSKNKIAIIYISVVVPVVVLVVLVISWMIWRRKRKTQISTYDHPNAPKPNSAAVSIKSHGDNLHNSENRQFTYKELEKFTNKFERSIGQGGFGLVYYGRLEDDTEVAVKMRSETSSHGLDEFLAEVNSLTKVHHRNLVSLVGYCWEKDHLALVYEYMSQGSLCDLLRGKIGVGETLSWGTRVRIVLESAQGLDYLHKGCSLPIIHRDVKTNNILLGQNMRAKIADFGLCKTYLSDMQTHVSTNAAGSAGYMDPEYYHTGWLTESSDVYSFGVVLLEVATGEPPIMPGHGHIVQRVKHKIASGNVSMVADAKLGGAYDVNSMWKLIDTAMACTSDAAIRRPTMAVVVAQLKESLALEESREDNSVQGRFTSTAGAPVSAFGPSAR